MRRSVLVVLGLATLGCRGIYAPTLADGGTEDGTVGSSGSTEADSQTTPADTSDTLDTLDTSDTSDTPDTSDTDESPDTSETDPTCGADEVEVGGGCLGFRESVSGASMPVDLVLADVSGDPNLDVIVADQAGPPRVYAALGGVITGGGTTFTDKIATSLARFDVDNDGQLDIAAGGAEEVMIFRTLGGGGFAEETPLPFASTVDVAAGFIDADGAADLVISSSGSSVIIALNQIGMFVQGDLLPSGDPGNVVAGDFDGDGTTDIAFIDVMTFSVVVYANNGMFSFGGTVELPSAFGLAAGDLDNDADEDDEIVVTSPDGSSLTVIDVGDDFALTTSFYSVGQGPRQVALGDVDGDGVLDAVTANRQSNDVSILLGDGNGGFGPEIRIAAPGTMQAESIALGDLDADFMDEIIVGGLATGEITVFGY